MTPEQLCWHPESRSRMGCICISQVKVRFTREILGLCHHRAKPMGHSVHGTWDLHALGAMEICSVLPETDKKC